MNPDPFAESLRRASDALRMNGVEFAALAGIKQPQMALYMTGKRRPRVEVVARICARLPQKIAKSVARDFVALESEPLRPFL